MSNLSMLGMLIEVGPPRWLIVALVVAFILIVSSATRKQGRKLERRWEVKICPRCGANEPPHAMFCGTCGTRM